MKNKILTTLYILAFVGGFFTLYFSGSTKQAVPIVSQTNQQADTSQLWVQKIDEQSEVTVIVTPIDILSQSKEWKFDITLSTHSVELDQDMTEVAILTDDSGKEYKPTAWEGSTGGHHREGVLKFNKITPIPKSVELKISGIGDIMRSFTW